MSELEENCSKNHVQLNQRALAMWVLEKKNFKNYMPLHDRRVEIISGKHEELKAERPITAPPKKENSTPSPTPNGVPEFWLVAMKNLEPLASLITAKDEEVLRYLINIRISYFDVPGHRIEFEFSENEFFKDKVLTKSYFYPLLNDGDLHYHHAEGMEISWNAGKDLTVRVETKKQRNKSVQNTLSHTLYVETNRTNTIRQTVETNSFFNFFKPPIPMEDAGERKEDDRLKQDNDIGEYIKEELIPEAIILYVGGACGIPKSQWGFWYHFVNGCA